MLKDKCKFVKNHKDDGTDKNIEDLKKKFIGEIDKASKAGKAVVKNV